MRWIVGGGVVPVILCMVLQASAAVAHGVDLAACLAVGLVLLVRLALDHDTTDHVYLSMLFVESHGLGRDVAEDDTWEESTPLVTGPLPDLWNVRAFAVALFRAAEITASVSVLACFDAAARSILGFSDVGFGAPLLMAAQFAAHLAVFRMTTGWISTSVLRAFVACAFLPKAVLDADTYIVGHYAVVLAGQVVVGVATLLVADTPGSTVGKQVMFGSVALMWVLLPAVRGLSVHQARAPGAVALAEKVRTGIVQLQPLGEIDENVPRAQLLSFCRSFTESLFGKAFEADRRQGRLDLSESDLQIAVVCNALHLAAPLLSGVAHFELNLDGTAVGDNDIAELVEHLPISLVSLELNLAGTKVGDVGAVQLAQKLPPSLTSFEAGFNSTKVTDRGLAVLAQNLPAGLTSLEAIFHNTKVSDKGLKALAQRLPKRLTHLRAGFYRTDIGDEGLEAFAAALPEGLVTLKAEFAGTKVTDEGAKALKENLPETLTNFEANFSGTKVSEELKAELTSREPTFKGRMRPVAVDEADEEQNVQRGYCCVLPWCMPKQPR